MFGLPALKKAWFVTDVATIADFTAPFQRETRVSRNYNPRNSILIYITLKNRGYPLLA
jgi:hypothetical protein